MYLPVTIPRKTASAGPPYGAGAVYASYTELALYEKLKGALVLALYSAEVWASCTSTADVTPKIGCSHASIKLVKSILYDCSQGCSKIRPWTNTVSFLYILF